MNRRKLIWGSALSLVLLAGGVGLAQNGMWQRHPILASAEQLTQQAQQRLAAAQQANQWDMNGHAAHAQALLQQAAREIALAAREADTH